MAKRLTIEEIKRRVFEIHGNSVTIDESTYKAATKKCIFNHITYGAWEATPNSIMFSKGSHPQIFIDRSKLTKEELDKRIYGVHGDTIKLLYSSYIATSKKAKFNHKTYGEFEAIPNNVFKGASHLQEYLDGKATPLSEIKKRIFEKHGDIVSIIENTYKGCRKKAIFVHKEFGKWETRVESVTNGSTHPSATLSTKSGVEEKIRMAHGDTIKIVWGSFTNILNKCKFIHTIYGEFESRPTNIFKGQGCKFDRSDRRAKTNINKYGTTTPAQNREIGLKSVRSQTKSTIKTHWKTGEELICQAGWEPKVVDYLNTNKINYLWQPQVFDTPILTPKGNKSTYRPDMFLIDENMWIEIKGFFRKDALDKWNWFTSEHSNSELWDLSKLKYLGIL